MLPQCCSFGGLLAISLADGDSSTTAPRGAGWHGAFEVGPMLGDEQSMLRRGPQRCGRVVRVGVAGQKGGGWTDVRAVHRLGRKSDTQDWAR